MEIVLFVHPDVSLPPQSGRPGSEEDIVSQSGPLSKRSVGRTGRDEPHQFGGSGECQRQAAKEIQGRLGEVSACRQALDGACLAPGDLKTQKALEDPTRRPPAPRELCQTGCTV